MSGNSDSVAAGASPCGAGVALAAAAGGAAGARRARSSTLAGLVPAEVTRPAGRTRTERPASVAALARLARRTDPAAWAIAAVAFVIYTTLSVSRYVRLDPGSWDLALFTEYVKQFAHLHAPVVAIKRAHFNLLGDHFTPILVLLAPLFRLFPTPVTLLVAQALLTAASVLPVARVAREKLGTGVSRAVAVAYALSWGLQSMIYFDFHEVAFAVPLVAFSVTALLLRRVRAAALWALPLVFVKEDQGFTVAAIGVVMGGAAVQAWRGRGRLADRAHARAWAWAGGLLIAWGLAGSILAITVIIPHFNTAHQYVYWRDGGVLGARGSHFSLPGLLSQLGLGAGLKLRTLLLLLLPVLCLALRSPLVLIEAPGLALRFMSTHRQFWGTEFHYSATAMPILFIAAIDGLARISARHADASRERGQAPAAEPLGAALPRYAAAGMVVVAAGLTLTFPFSRLLLPSTYTVTAHVRAEEAAMAMVPAGVKVETTESTLASFAARNDTSWIVTNGIRDPRYVLYDARRTGLRPRPRNVLAFIERQHPGAFYRQIFASHRVYEFERVPAGAAAPRPGGVR